MTKKNLSSYDMELRAHRLNVLLWGLLLGSVILLSACFSLMILGSAWAGDLPNHRLTPGVAEPHLTKPVICARTFRTGAWRHVPANEKKAVYAEYHMAPHAGDCALPRGCEVDHLISLELGGSNDIRNLWIQPYSTHPWNAVEKDVLETRLHDLVCQDLITLEDAQSEISVNWITSYKKRIGAASH